MAKSASRFPPLQDELEPALFTVTATTVLVPWDTYGKRHKNLTFEVLVPSTEIHPVEVTFLAGSKSAYPDPELSIVRTVNPGESAIREVVNANVSAFSVQARSTDPGTPAVQVERVVRAAFSP